MYFKIFNNKVLNNADNHKGFQYTDGLNTDTHPFNNDPTDSCGDGGFYFTDEKQVGDTLHTCDYVREVEVPEGSEMLSLGYKYRAHSLFLHEKRYLNDVSTWEWLVKNGVDVTGDSTFNLQEASENGNLAVVKYLVSQGADVTEHDNYAIMEASENGQLAVVEYLLSQGAVLPE